VEPDGSILVVLEPAGLIERARREGSRRQNIDAVHEAAPQHQASIVVVDDALTVRELERSILESAGYRVRTAADGAEALLVVAQERPDLVITDVQMPRMDGFALTRAIRADARLATVPIIIVTSQASAADRQQGLEAGADSYIVKSAFDQAALLGAVDRLLGAS
jgi:two-component system chemotaxis sensor kinase CheA